jgi:hypothetical protein
MNTHRIPRTSLSTALALAFISASTPRAGTGRLPSKNEVLLGAGGLHAIDGMAEPGAAPVGTPPAGLLAASALAKDGISAMADKDLPGANTGSPPKADGVETADTDTDTGSITFKDGASTKLDG